MTPPGEAEAAVSAAAVRLYEPASATLPYSELRSLVNELVQAVDRGAIPASELWALGAMHPRAEVRLEIIDAAAGHPEDPDAGALLAWAANDVDDRVAVLAVGVLNDRPDAAAIDEVFDAAGRSLAALDGFTFERQDQRAHATVAALRSLMRSHPQPEEMRRRLAWTGYDRRQTLLERDVDMTGMVYVPPGPGVSTGFYIDRYPVTWHDYAGFVGAVREHGMLWAHPGAPADHDYDVVTPLEADQIDALSDHPITGVTWYDAWAYAAWRGAVLPTTAQWELAAGGDAGSRYPWGEDSPTERHAHFSHVSGDSRAFAHHPIEPMTSPIGDHPDGATALDVQDLAGNVWEWTRSRALDGDELSPYVGSLSYAEMLGTWTLMACVKGGSWMSDAPDLECAARASKHVLQRGPETGFRCAFEPPWGSL